MQMIAAGIATRLNNSQPSPIIICNIWRRVEPTARREADFRFPVLITEPESADDSQEYIEDQECHKGYPVTDGICHSVCKIKFCFSGRRKSRLWKV